MNTLDAFANPGIEHIPSFLTALEEARLQADFEAWCDYTRKSPLLRKWRYFLAVDPYTRWGLVKPRGYAGDATLMDFAYGHPSIQDEVRHAGPVGAAIYEYTSGAPQSASARLRIELIATEITRLARNGPMRVASYACGHARELEQLSATTAAQIELFMALDADERSLAEARRSAGAMAFEGHRCNVIKQDLSALQPCTLVYSLGLFDYLNDEHAVQVILKMLAQTAPGGTLLLANLAPTAANLGYCEAIMDWWMIPRSEADLLALAQTALAQTGPGPASAQASVEQHGCFNYLRIQAVAKAD